MKYSITITNNTQDETIGVYEKRGGAGIYEALNPIGEVPPNGSYTCECCAEIPIIVKPLIAV